MMSTFILSAFADEISPHLDEQIAVLQQHDIHYLEFRSLESKSIIDYSNAEIRAISARLRDAGVGVSALGSPIGKIGITDPFPPHLERFKKAVETAGMLGTPYIRMFSFFIPQGDDPNFYRDEVMTRWEAFRHTAQGSGLTLLHENEKSIYGDTAERCLDLLKTMDSPLIRATFDPANFVQCGVETYPHAYEMLKDYIAYMHIKDAKSANGEVVPAGFGDGCLTKILRALHAAGYQGFLSLEPHLNNSLPGGGPTQFALAANALKKILADIT
jgi:sugar phosphate isomerase/epimerase